MHFFSCRYLQQIEIPINSKLQTIEQSAFAYTCIENLSIPSRVTELKESWCFQTENIKKNDVSSSNQYYKGYENNKMIISKTKNKYNRLIFCARDIEKVTNPNFIEHIDSCAFNKCLKLKNIEIPKDSKLKTICMSAFLDSGLVIFVIPSHVAQFGLGSFCNCQYLKRIEFESDSKLQTIPEKAFSDSVIESIIIPREVTKIEQNAFSNCRKLQRIKYEKDSKLQVIEKNHFRIQLLNVLKFHHNY